MRPDNLRAINAYKSIGFKQQGEIIKTNNINQPELIKMIFDKDFMKRYAVYIFINQNLNEDDIFDSREFPLHLTLMPNFYVDNIENIKIGLTAIAKNNKRIKILIGEEAMFRNGEVLVNKVISNIELNSIHNLIHKILKKEGAIFNNDSFVGTGFKPHITVQKTDKVKQGQIVELNGFSLIQLEPNGVKHKRLVLNNYKLNI